MDIPSSSSSSSVPDDAIIAQHFPTREEMEFLRKFADIVDGTKKVQITSDVLKVGPTRIALKNVDQFPTNVRLDQNIGRLFDIFIRAMIKECGGNLQTTKFWINLQHPGYHDDDGFYIMHKTYQMANGHTLINTIARHSQSKKELAMDEAMIFTMRIFTRPPKARPGKGGRIPDQILRKFGVKTRNVVGTGHCLPKALIIGMAWSDMQNNKCHSTTNSFKRLTRAEYEHTSRPKIQLREAKALLKAAKMRQRQSEHTLDDLKKLAKHLSNYRIRVWALEDGVAVPTVVFDENQSAEGFIPIFYAQEHYEFFKPTCPTVGVRFCFKCHKLADDKHWKKCSVECKRCGRDNCIQKLDSMQIYCAECNINFYSQECYDAHLEKPSAKSLPFCSRYEKCKECYVIHRREEYAKDKHVCYHSDFCNVCMEKVSGDHDCVHAAPTQASRKRALERQSKWTIVIYDIETIVVKSGEYRGTDNFGVKHEPNLICYKLVCEKCKEGECERCGKIETISYKDKESGSVIERFASFLKEDPRLVNAYVIAHNGGRYDHVFTLEEMMRKDPYEPDFTMTGSAFISANVKLSKKNTLHFRDSVRYMAMKLDQLPSAFGLPTKSKGHFPYLFNHPDNYGTILPTLPPIDYYEPKLMGVKARAEFEEWYESAKDHPFDFDQEIVDYCKNDVKILTEAVVNFIKLCEPHCNGWNPIIQSPTLASYILFVLKYQHIKTGDIGYIPENGWPGRNNSKYALKYLLWLEHETPGLELVHKLRKSGEHYVTCGERGFFVDGFNPETLDVYEVHGCMWHGCPKCYLDREAKCPRNKNMTMEQLWDKTVEREQVIREAGYNLRTIWECEIKEMLQKNGKMAKFFKNCSYTARLNPRMGMNGGRTQQFQSLVTATDEFSIEFLDFCSLYPYINIKGTVYPRGAPHKITENFAPTDESIPYNGLVYCDLLPPPQCPIPIAPVRTDSKLLFPLCKSCAFSKQSGPCTHTKISERYFTGVWCTDELKLAQQEGYQILKYHEAWHWEPEAWFRGGFFESFMKPLLKMKHEASGWPQVDMTQQEKLDYAQDIFDKDGVWIELDKVEHNPGLRSFAKLFLNSVWGKFAQNPLKTETRLIPISKAVEIWEFFEEPGYEPKCFKEWGEHHVLVARRPLKENVKTAKFTSIVYGALTTSAARIKLFKAMQLVGAENLIYCDTDSIIFKQKRGTDPLKSLKGDALGQLTSEVPSGWKIEEIVAMAPKVYALKMVDAQGNHRYVTKAKGITLNSETMDKINFETMRKMVTAKLDGVGNQETIVRRMRMKRGSNILDGLRTVIEPKRVRPMMDKGHFDESGVLQPFGTHCDNIEFDDDYMF